MDDLQRGANADADCHAVPRRAFMTDALTGAAITGGVLSGLSMSGSDASAAPAGTTAEGGKAAAAKTMRLTPRYHRWHVDPGIDWTEANTGYAKLDWTVPMNQVALVLVDVWNSHYLTEPRERAEAIVNGSLGNLLDRSRQAGLTVIHAPSPPQAESHPNWVSAGKPKPPAKPRATWPPVTFRAKSGAHAGLHRPFEPRDKELAKFRAGLTIHPRVAPIGQEPVISTGEELHALCEERGILFLLFAGFNTNACILVRDYGTLAMSQRGYEVLVVRDCTTGMESPATQPTLSQTSGAILFLEMFGQYSIDSGELISGLPA